MVEIRARVKQDIAKYLVSDTRRRLPIVFEAQRLHLVDSQVSDIFQVSILDG